LNKTWVIIAAITSFFLTCLPAEKIIKRLTKLKYGQTILEIGPSWHKKKEGTPTMGGIIFIFGIVISFSMCLLLNYIFVDNFLNINTKNLLSLLKIFAGILMAIAYSVVGFIDDYIKISKKRNLGLSGKQKLIFQFLIAFVYLFFIYFIKQYFSDEPFNTIEIPFLGNYNFGIFYFIICSIMIVGIVNAVNLTDGIDGLTASVTFFTSVLLMMSSSFVNISYLDVISACLAGGCLGFLMFNFHPARVFMGDTGSLFLGGMICSIVFGLEKPLLLVSSGIVYLIEMFSVVLQVIYFKVTKGKRLFKMSPIHHHFEMIGWSEAKICIVFGFVSVIGGIFSLLYCVFSN
jgi:phospho-N-acetylmuramoyl-pentapeptide-transferase